MSSQLITQLKKQHAELVKSFEDIKAAGVASAEGQKKLLATKSSLLAHLKIEDAQLYPVLKQAASKDPSIGQMMDRYLAEMDEISKVALAFFDKYAKGGSGMEFARDYGKLVGTLSTRLRSEENVLYKKFDEIVAG